MKKLLLVGLVSLSTFSAVATPSVAEFREKSSKMTDSTLCLTMGAVQQSVDLGKAHDAQAVENMKEVFYERVNKMDEEQMEICRTAWSLGMIAASE